jgi:hypothetical protein
LLRVVFVPAVAFLPGFLGSDDGPRVADGILLCGHHHRLAHHPDHTHQQLPNGDLRYHRRT